LSGKAWTAFEPTKVLDAKRSVFGFRSSGIRTDLDTAFPGARYLQELADCLTWARDERIHVLCFPELSVCPEGQKLIAVELRKNAGVLGLVVGGSFHVGNGSDYVNAAPYWVVTTTGDVKSHPDYEKAEPFSTRVRGAKALPQMQQCCDAATTNGCVHLCEDITPGNKVHVVETSVGVFGILICRDFLSGQHHVEQYARVVDHLLVVSMNASENAWFWASSEDPLRSNAVATFYVNSTQIIRNPTNADVEVAFWNTPREKERVYRALPTARPGARAMAADGRILTTFQVPAVLINL
jgi:hypothetical protein